MKTLCLLALAPLATVVACPAPPPPPPPPPPDITAACTDPTTVPCQTAMLQDLNMITDGSVTAGVVESTDNGDHFHAHVDASVGGLNGQGYVYAKFTDTGLVRVELDDVSSLDSMDWDVAFHRFVIRLNSGTGGPSCVTAARTAANTDFAALATVDTGLTFNAEAFMTDGTCDMIPDGSGLGTDPGVVLQSYWHYVGCLQMTGNVYVIERADGHHVKLVVNDFYDEAAQAECNTAGTLAANHQSAQLQFDWAFLD